MGFETGKQKLGTFFEKAREVKALLKTKNIDATLINPRFITGLDTTLLQSLQKGHQFVVTLEDGELDGGFGEKVARFYGTSPVKVLNYGAFKEFTDKVPQAQLYAKYHLTAELIVQDLVNAGL